MGLVDIENCWGGRLTVKFRLSGVDIRVKKGFTVEVKLGLSSPLHQLTKVKDISLVFELDATSSLSFVSEQNTFGLDRRIIRDFQLKALFNLLLQKEFKFVNYYIHRQVAIYTTMSQRLPKLKGLIFSSSLVKTLKDHSKRQLISESRVGVDSLLPTS